MARELAGLLIEMGGQPEDLGDVGDASLALGALHPRYPEGECDVVAHAEVRVKGVVLEDHRDVAVCFAAIVDHLAADAHRARRDRLQAGDHAQDCRLPAPRRPDEHEQLAVGDPQIDVTDGDRSVGIGLAHRGELDLSHRSGLQG
jgi:hypothetical protein